MQILFLSISRDVTEIVPVSVSPLPQHFPCISRVFHLLLPVMQSLEV